MYEFRACGIEDMACDVPLVQPLHDDHLRGRRRIGLAGGERFVVGTDRLLALDVAFSLLHRVRVIDDLDVTAAPKRSPAHRGGEPESSRTGPEVLFRSLVLEEDHPLAPMTLIPGSHNEPARGRGNVDRQRLTVADAHK